MYPKKQLISVAVFLFFAVCCFSQNIKESNESFVNKLKTKPLDSLEYYVIKDYDNNKYNAAIDIAIIMSENRSDILVQQRGVNLLALLAKCFTKRVKDKSVDLDNEKTKLLLLRFEAQRYFIEKPKVSRFIKTMNYLCKGEYIYVHKKLSSISTYKFFLAFISIYFLIFLLSYLKQFKFKHKKMFRRFTLVSLAMFILLFLIFKQTCHNNIKDYTFYGISV